MAFTEQDITQALQSLIDPITGATFASAKAFKNIKVQGADVQLDLELGYPAKSQWPALIALVTETARTVAGVGSVQVTRFQRQGQADPKPLADGFMTLGRLEIARLDNDPNFPEHGVLRLELHGGK